MKEENCKISIVCDKAGCGRLSAYRLVFDNGSAYYLCSKCRNELKDYYQSRAKKDEAK